MRKHLVVTCLLFTLLATGAMNSFAMVNVEESSDIPNTSYLKENMRALSAEIKRYLPESATSGSDTYYDDSNEILFINNIRFENKDGHDFGSNFSYNSKVITNHDLFLTDLNSDLVFTDFALHYPEFKFSSNQSMDSPIKKRNVVFNGIKFEGKEFDEVYNAQTGEINVKFLYDKKVNSSSTRGSRSVRGESARGTNAAPVEKFKSNYFIPRSQINP